MKCVDWREAAAHLVLPLYRAERERWATELDWDSSANWVVVEAARAQGTLPGYLVVDRSGTVAGWAFYHLHGDVLQIGGLTGRSASVARCLLDTIMRAPETARARDVSCFVLPDRQATAAFVQRRFDALAFLYLRKALEPSAPSPAVGEYGPPVGGAVLRPWQPHEDAPDAVRLMAQAYGASAAARCFAGSGGVEGWVNYVRQLIHTPACGVLLPTGSYVARTSDGELGGVVLTTSIGPRAAHIAQLVVHPSLAGRGLGRRLLDAACAAAAAEGRRAITLLVSEENTAARALYERAEFEERSQFLFGWRARPIPRTADSAAA